MDNGKLSPQDWDRVFQDVRRWQEQGCNQPKLEDSLLGLDWSSFEAREFPELGDWPSGRNPPEFISFAFSALDAYAAAVLTTNVWYPELGVLSFICSLRTSARGSQMHLEFRTSSERGWIPSKTLMVKLLQSFPQLLKARGLEPNTVLFLVGEGCPMSFEYPGKMLAEASPFLRDRLAHLWPQVTLRLTPTNRLIERAMTILEFQRSSSIEGHTN